MPEGERWPGVLGGPQERDAGLSEERSQGLLIFRRKMYPDQDTGGCKRGGIPCCWESEHLCPCRKGTMFCWNLQSLFQASHVLGKSKGTDEAHLWG